ncbi:MAG: hypothetical protein E6R08_00295 [Nevskiaceae bacterium]|nr:MAG: hypothetical protein E6R08_00295 [Nevskiaceae bacterium]
MAQSIPRFATISSLLAHQKYEACAAFDKRSNGLIKQVGALRWAVDEGLGFGADALAVRTLPGMSADQLLDEHSMFPMLSRMLPTSQRSFWRQAFIRGAPLAARLISDCRRVGLLQSGSKAYCPTCVAEDLAALDTSFWRTFHQLPFVRNCAVHGCALRYKCGDCGTPFSRAVWHRQPHDSCETCRSTNIWQDRRPERSPGLFDMEALVWNVLFNDCGLDMSRVKRIETQALVRAWGCESERELLTKLGVRERPIVTPLYRRVLGEDPIAMCLAKVSFAIGAAQAGRPKLYSRSDTMLTRRNEARRRCPSWVPPTHMKLVQAGRRQ